MSYLEYLEEELSNKGFNDFLEFDECFELTPSTNYECFFCVKNNGVECYGYPEYYTYVFDIIKIPPVQEVDFDLINKGKENYIKHLNTII